jgi:DNA end-binding protein Ku
MYWPDEIREADFGGVDVSGKVTGQELEMARQLIDSLAGEWTPDSFSDEYREALLKIVEAKLHGQEIEVVAAEPTAKVVDLMEALKASVAAAKKQGEPAPEKSKPKKPAAKKPSSKKPAAKKTTSRKKAVGE